MTWEDFVQQFKIENESNGELTKINISFNAEKNNEPSEFTMFNTHFLKSIETYEKKKMVIVYPNNYYFLASLLLFKTFSESFSGDNINQFNPRRYKVGDILCLGKAVFKIAEINDSIVMFEFAGKNKTDKAGFLINKIPSFSYAKPNSQLTSKRIYEAEVERLLSTKNDSVIGKLIRQKNLFNNTVVIVGSTQKYGYLLSNCQVNGHSLSEMLNIGKADKEGNIKPLNGNFDNYQIILCPELYIALHIMKQNRIDIESFFIDASLMQNVNEMADDLDDLDDLNKEVVVFVKENSSFEYDELKVRDFAFFQWKKRFLNDRCFEEEKLDASLLAFRDRTIQFVKLKDDCVSSLYYQFLGYKDEIPDMHPVAICAYNSFFTIIKDRMTKYCYLTNQEMVFSQMLALDNHCKELKSIKKEIIGNHELIKTADDTYNKIFDFLLNTNEKIEYIWKEIISCQNENDKIAIIVPDDFDIDEVKNYFVNRARDNNIFVLFFDVIAISDFQYTKWHYHKTIFTGWFRKTIMKTALLSNNSDCNIVLLYQCEIPWVKSAEKLWNETSIENHFPTINPEINDNTTEKLIEFIDDSATKNDDIDETSKEQSEIFMGGLLKQNTDTEFIEAIPFVFSNGSYAIFPANKAITSLTNMLSNETDEPESVLVSDVKLGDVLIIKDNSSKDVLEEMAEKIINSDDVIALSKCWKEAIVTNMASEGITVQKMMEKIKLQGCKRHDLTIKSWIINESMICPRDKQDLVFIASATGDVLLSEEINQVFEAANKIKSARIKAGHKLSNILTSSPKIKETIDRYKQDGVLNVKNQTIIVDTIGSVSILKVIEIGTKQEFPKILCNKRRMN